MRRTFIFTVIIFGLFVADSAEAQFFRGRGRIVRARTNIFMPAPVRRFSQYSTQSYGANNRQCEPQALAQQPGLQPRTGNASASNANNTSGQFSRFPGSNVYSSGTQRVYARPQTNPSYQWIRTPQGVVAYPNQMSRPASAAQNPTVRSIFVPQQPATALNAPLSTMPVNSIPSTVSAPRNSVVPVSNSQMGPPLRVKTIEPVRSDVAPAKNPQLSGPVSDPAPASTKPGAKSVLETRRK